MNRTREFHSCVISHTLRAKRKASSFTLLELLVVIAIIAMLASMFLPLLNKAKENARKIRCISNLKQVIAIGHFYADSYNGYLPLNAFTPSGETKAKLWYTVMDEAGVLQSKKILYCSSLATKYNTAQVDSAGMGYTYGMIRFPNSVGSIRILKSPVRVIQGGSGSSFYCKNAVPSKAIIFADSIRKSSDIYMPWYIFNPNTGMVGETGMAYAQHDPKRVSSAFADGHAGAAGVRDLADSGINYYSFSEIVAPTGAIYNYKDNSDL